MLSISSRRVGNSRTLRNDFAVIAFLVGLAAPSDRLGAARKITDAVAFDIRLLWPVQLQHDANSLVVFLNSGLDFADVLLIGGDGSAGLLRRGRYSSRETGQQNRK